jgi:hypothetical protein
MKETMLRRIPLAILLAIQALGGGAISLAHSRDLVTEPAHVEASHNARCAILHDEMRCALCHYASARVVTQQVFTLPAPVLARRVTPTQVATFTASSERFTPPPRAPPTLLS